MSIKYNGKLIAGKYKTQIVTDATESNKGLIRIATLEEVNAGTDNTTAVTPKDLAKKQNTLTAGEGIKIENGIISTESTKILTDNVTIIQNDDNTITSIGTKTKSNTNLYDWVGTEEEYNTSVLSGVITGDTQCIITDDEQELIGTVELNIPTKVSDLANDSNFISSVELDTKQDKLTAGDGIKIENNIISTESTKILTDNNTIIQNEDSTITSIATKTKSNTIKIDWEGTNEEYEAGIADGSISSDWYCYITDDETIVDFNDFANNSLSNLSEAGQAIVDYKANTDLDNLSEVGEKHFLNKSQITNCLTEVPQRIKYTLENGTLTIKAGTVVIVPYGTTDQSATYPVGSTFLNENFKVYDMQFVDSKFFVWVELQNDIAFKTGYSDSRIFWIRPSTGILEAIRSNCAYSSDTAPTAQQYMYWYDTANNLVKYTANTGSTWGPALTLPILIAQTGSGEITSVQQVFNGMGYIGQCTWVDKDVKCLFADGRNADGTCKNFEFTNPELTISNLSGQTSIYGQIAYRNGKIFLFGYGVTNVFEQDTKPSFSGNYALWFDTSRNEVFNTDNGSTWGKLYEIVIPELTKPTANGNITSFKPKQPFKALDYNDKSNISGWSLPSTKYIDLALGASGASYTAPANGWVQCGCMGTAGSTYFELVSEYVSTCASYNGGWGRACMPVFKGMTFYIYYGGTNFTAKIFRFTYAQGEV